MGVAERTSNQRQKLLRVYNDPRSCFYPTTNDELSLAIEALDLADSRKDDTLLKRLEDKVSGAEFKRTGSGHHARETSEAAVQSRLHSMGDMLTNAIESTRAIQLIKYLSEGYQPRGSDTTIEDTVRGEADISHVVAPLARYVILDKFAKTGERPAKLDPLRTHKNRNSPELWRPGAHKRIEDPFTCHEIDKHPLAAIETFAAETPVIAIRRLLPYAIIDQEKRREFWQARFSEVPDNYRRLAKFIVINSHQ